jgi:hypothetical protein
MIPFSGFCGNAITGVLKYKHSTWQGCPCKYSRDESAKPYQSAIESRYLFLACAASPYRHTRPEDHAYKRTNAAQTLSLT